jgi:hypothetical protein
MTPHVNLGWVANRHASLRSTFDSVVGLEILRSTRVHLSTVHLQLILRLSTAINNA